MDLVTLFYIGYKRMRVVLITNHHTEQYRMYSN